MHYTTPWSQNGLRVPLSSVRENMFCLCRQLFPVLYFVVNQQLFSHDCSRQHNFLDSPPTKTPLNHKGHSTTRCQGFSKFLSCMEWWFLRHLLRMSIWWISTVKTWEIFNRYNLIIMYWNTKSAIHLYTNGPHIEYGVGGARLCTLCGHPFVQFPSLFCAGVCFII